jgi:hypothetical protein
VLFVNGQCWPGSSESSKEKTNEIKALQDIELRFIQQHPILISGIAGFAAILLMGCGWAAGESCYKPTTYKIPRRNHDSERRCS